MADSTCYVGLATMKLNLPTFENQVLNSSIESDAAMNGSLRKSNLFYATLKEICN